MAWSSFPAKAGIQQSSAVPDESWAPAFAGEQKA
jgi:hypothetical protein